MSGSKWQKIEEIFEAVVELSPAKREVYLAEVCDGNADLRREIEQLLSADEQASDFIESPILGNNTLANFLPDAIEDSVAPHFLGKRVGAYQLVRELGRGGMGAVFLARRADDEFRKQVAIKVIKRGMDTDFILRRFRNERQILATLDHPFIARLLDGGTTEDGLPYFVMEYIEGLPVSQYCDTNRLSIRERLELFRLICSAVNYAHQNLIIHRDLKPGNILVTKDGTPKLLDFGIAKILDPNLSANTLSATLTGMRLMTPEYASPEQIRGEVLTPASDIYSLGVLLYEVLTGKRPYRFSSRAPHDIARVVCEEEPETPAMVITKDEFSPEVSTDETVKSLEILSRNRQTTPENLRRELSGDVQNILLKALCKTADCRYLSAEDFSKDIGAFLNGEPVSAPYLIQTTDDRFENSFLTASESLAVLPFRMIRVKTVSETGDYLSLGLADALITRLSHLRSVSVRPTSSVLKYIKEDTLEPSVAGRELRVTHVLDGRIQQVGKRVRVTAQLVKIRTNETVWAGQFDEQSDDILSLQDSISAQVAEALLHKLTGEERRQLEKRGTNNAKAYETYLRGRFHWHSYTVEGLAKALVCFYEAIALDPDFALAYTGVADYYNFLSVFGVMSPAESFPAAKEAATKAIELDDSLAEAYTSLGIVEFGYEWNFAEAERLFKRAVELNPNYAEAHVWTGQLYGIRGKHDLALKSMRRAESLNPQSPSLLVVFALCLRNARRYDEALQKLRYALTLQPNFYTALQGYNWVAEPLGIFAEAEKACRQAVELTGRLSLPLYSYAYTLAVSGKPTEARAIAEELEERKKRQYVPSIYNALIYTALGETDSAFKWLDKSIEERDFWAIWFPIDPRFDPLKTDARYDAYVKKIKPLNGAQDIHQSHIATKILPIEKVELPSDHAKAETILPSAPRKRRWLYAAGLLIFPLLIFVLFAGMRLGWQFADKNRKEKAELSATPNANARKTIAVLPFAPDEAGEIEESLSVSLAQVLTSKLGQVRSLTVLPAFLTENRGKTITESLALGEELGATYLLRGTLHQSDEKIEVLAQLISVSDGKILWEEKFDEQLSDLPNLQTAISEQVLRVLTVQLSASEQRQISKKYTENSEAYQLYLAGRYQLSKRSAESLSKAIQSFNQAVEKDAQFASAYAGLANAYALLNLYQTPPPKDAYAKASEYAQKAVALDANLPEAHASLGFVKFYGELDVIAAEKSYRRAIELNPSSENAHHWLALALVAQGRYDEALTEINLAKTIAPNSTTIVSAAGIVYFYARKYAEAEHEARAALVIDEGSLAAIGLLRWTSILTERYDEAFAYYQKEKLFGSGEETVGSLINLAQVQAGSGQDAEALATLKELFARKDFQKTIDTNAFDIALIYVSLGKNSEAIQWLEKSAKTFRFNFYRVDPRLDNLRSDPRFNDLLQRTSK